MGQFRNRKKYMTNKMKEIYELDMSGKKASLIARQLGFSVARVYNVRNSAVYKKYVIDNNEDVVKKVKKEFATAREIEAKTLSKEVAKSYTPVIRIMKKHEEAVSEEIARIALEGKQERDRIAAGDKVLIYAGNEPPKNVITQSYQLSSDDADKIAFAMQYTQTRIRGTDQESGGN
jgi:hypothetical protein